MLAPDVVRRLAEALRAAGFGYDAVAGLLGPVAHAALSRNETTPGLRATTGGSPLATLTRLWPLQATVAVADAERALPGLVDDLCRAGLLERSVGEVRARVDLRPYADDSRDWWVVSDLTPGLDGAGVRVSADHVLGISSASSSLAQLTVREPVLRALDLGTGCGVQALHLAEHAREIVATDVNQRALAMTRLNAALNDVQVDVRPGSLYEPVAGELFDLVVTNPPFVVSPATGERLVYRDSGLPGDEMVRRVVTQAPRHLAPGGIAQVLANWVHRRGEPWQERIEGWLAGTGVDAWVVQREVADPAAYVELWLKDAGLHGAADYLRRYDTWLSWFEEQGIEGIGFGWLHLRRPATDREPVRHLEEWPYEVEQPLGAEVADRFRRGDRLRDLGTDEGLLAARLVVRADVREETAGRPGQADPETIVLRQQRGMRRAHQADTVLAGLVGACDGELTLGQILDALATLLDHDAAMLREGYLDEVRGLVADGFLEVALPG
ncbi:methyltransferase [Nocardioides mesophilus]|uniref:Methyltransferase n=1 Tax=Nocardioides mesophilus TaxID=433659 RepID=A0A7G9RH96_9ACTN|nr:methyltransferase [Nocardioides mesophilus]